MLSMVVMLKGAEHGGDAQVLSMVVMHIGAEHGGDAQVLSMVRRCTTLFEGEILVLANMVR